MFVGCSGVIYGRPSPKQHTAPHKCSSSLSQELGEWRKLGAGRGSRRCLFEILQGPEFDLTSPAVLATVLEWIKSSVVAGVWLGTPFGTRSRARCGRRDRRGFPPPLRSLAPWRASRKGARTSARSQPASIQHVPDDSSVLCRQRQSSRPRKSGFQFYVEFRPGFSVAQVQALSSVQVAHVPVWCTLGEGNPDRNLALPK